MAVTALLAGDPVTITIELDPVSGGTDVQGCDAGEGCPPLYRPALDAWSDRRSD